MVTDKKPIERIKDLMANRATWTDEQILDELSALPELPDEYLEGNIYNPVWGEDEVVVQLDL